MQIQSSVSLWLNAAEDEGRANSQETSPALADVLAGLDEQPRQPADFARAVLGFRVA